MKNQLPVSAILLLFLFPSMVFCQQTVQKMVSESKYLLYLPEHYKDDTLAKWPLLMFLHGSGESGEDITKVKMHGPPKLIEQGKQFPFIIVSPQSPVPYGWDVDQLYKLLQQVKKTYRVDNDRIYCTGLSMGGFGTWKMAMKYPDEFAAIAPVCGGGDTAEAWKLRNIPVWCFHGALDYVVPVSGSQNMVKAAARLNPHVRLTVYPDKDHNSWDTTYDRNDLLYTWLLQQKKFRYTPVATSEAALKKYEGWYRGEQGDTVQLFTRKNALVAVPGRDTVVLGAAGNHLFYLQPDKMMDIRFVSEKNKITSFWFMGDRKLLYRRIANRK